MDVPGLSLFQGGESLKINSSLQRIEEEEAIEDQKRRNEELQNQLQNAFDDLIDDEDETVDTSANFQSNLSNDSYRNLPVPHNFNTNTNVKGKVNEFGQGDRLPSQPPPDYYNHQQQTEVSKLRKLFEDKSLEYDKLNLRYNEDKDKLESQNNELRKRLTIAEAEKERTNMSRQQTHELLVESKTKVSDLEDKITKLKAKIKTLENTNTNLVTELENTKTMLSDAQHKFHLVERNIGLNADKHTDVLLKQANDRHNGQMEIMQQQVNNLQSKLDDREMELKTLDARYKELQRSREQLLCDKSETINQLAKNLEDSQRQCQQLISRPDLTQENIRLERLLAARERQIDDMQKTVNNLTQKLEATSIELQLMDSVLCDGNNAMDSYRSPKLGNSHASTPFATTDERLGRLKNELLRCMSTKKQQRDEIQILEEKLMRKNDEINLMKNNENDTLLKMNKYKEEANVLFCKLNAMENELRKMQTGSNTMKNAEKSIKDENEQKVRKLEEKCMELEEQLEEVTVNYTNLKKDYEVLVNDKRTLCEENKQMVLDVEKNKFLLNEARTECEQVKNNYIELSNIKENLSRELQECKSLDCNKELYVQKERVSSLEHALELAEMKCNEMRKLSEANNKEHKQIINDLHEKYEKEISGLNREMKVKRSPCSKCIELATQLTQHDINNLQLKNDNKNMENFLNEKNNEIDNLTKKIMDLEQKLDLKEERDNLIIQLKEKALEFEAFMHKQSMTDKNNNNVNMLSKGQQTIIEYKDQCCSTSPTAATMNSSNGNLTKEEEAKIREDITKSFAVQAKNLQENYKLQIEKYQNLIQTLKTELDNKESQIVANTTDINLLKQVILVEREKIKEIIESLENQVKLLTGTNNDLTMELDVSKKRLKRLNEEMVEKAEQIKSERDSMNLLITQYNNEKKRLINEINLLKENNLSEYKDRYLQLKEKYESAKRTVQNYKLYSEDKEKHMINESKRMFDEYRNKVEKIEKRFQKKIELIEEEHKRKINIMEENDLRKN